MLNRVQDLGREFMGLYGADLSGIVATGSAGRGET